MIAGESVPCKLEFLGLAEPSDARDLSETHCGLWIVACCRAHPIACRCYNFCPTSRELRGPSAKRPKFASHFPLAFSPWRSFLRQCLRVKFDGLHAALECAADQRPGFTSGDQTKKPFFLFRRPAYPGIYASHFFAFSPSCERCWPSSFRPECFQRRKSAARLS
jgi:hypothetical protein